MDKFGNDYACETVGEGITKYSIPDNWCAEFVAWDEDWPIMVIQVDQIRKAPAMMDLRLRMIEDPEKEYAGCMILEDQKTVAFKLDHMSEFALNTMAAE